MGGDAACGGEGGGSCCGDAPARMGFDAGDAPGRAAGIGAVRISDVRGTQMAAEVEGTFEVGGEPLAFTAIAFGRIGGQNIGARLGADAEARLREMGRDPEETVLALQQMLVRGDIEIPDGVTRETFADRP